NKNIMSSPTTSFVNLNSVCIVEILKQIKKNCDINELTNSEAKSIYLDLINFALTCEWFRDEFWNWDTRLYESLEVEETYLAQSKSIIVDFKKLYKRLAKLNQKDKYSSWNIYVNCIKSNSRLEKIELRYVSSQYDKKICEVVGMIMDALQNKGRIKILIINMEGYNLEKLPQLWNLKQLTVNAKINANNLADYCKLNKSLSRLDLMNKELSLHLVDNVRHCKKLKDLTFMIKKDFSDTEYIELSTHFNLVNLRILGVHESGSLTPLIRALATKKSSRLTRLVIDAAPLDIIEIAEACEIKSLQEFRCRFVNLENFHLILYRVEGNDYVNFNFEQKSDATDLAFLAHLPKFQSLRIHGRHKTGTLKPLFKVIAEKESPYLQRLKSLEYIGGNKDTRTMFNNDEMQELLKIKTLDNLDCSFSDDRPMNLPTELPNLTTVTIATQKTAALLLAVLMGCLNEITVIRGFREITFNKKLRKLTITNSSYENDVFDAEEYAALAQLPQLKSLYIVGPHKLGTFKNLFGQLATLANETLQEIIFKNTDKYQDCSQHLLLNSDETKQIIKISSMKRLKCGFSDGKSVKLLPKLINLTELKLIRYPESSLEPLFQELASLDSSNLQYLVLSGSPLKYEEIAQVAKVNSLKRLHCALADGQNVELLAQLNQLEELNIKADECSSLVTLFQAFVATKSKTLRHLKIADRSMLLGEMQYISQITNLNKLCCTLNCTESIRLLTNLPDLRELSIELDQCETEGIEILAKLKNLIALDIKSPAVGSLKNLLTQPLNLQSLIIRENDIDSSETAAIGNIKSLERLKCGFDEEPSYEFLLALKNLEVLEITSFFYIDENSQFMLNLLQNCRKLKSIVLHYGGRFVEQEFLSNALRVLKEVRNPEEQEALRL
ncbi:hypothetical protein KR044_012649, partial [Drosophila immigrans]